MPTIAKQLRILEFIRRYMSANSEAPTIREIADYFDMTRSSAYANLRKMEARGWIKRSRKWRGIEVVEQEKAA